MPRRAWLLGLPLLFIPAAVAADGAAGEIAWQTSLAKSLVEAKASSRPLFVAINNVIAEGEGVEVASKLLREQVYVDPRIVEISKGFLCVLLRSPVSTEDGGELRTRYGIDGMIVTPQHLFLHSDGTLVQRKEYWEYRDRGASVDALSGMMLRALKAHEARQQLPPLGTDPSSRTAWIQAAVDLVRAGLDVELRKAAVHELASADQGGDCLGAMQAVLLGGKEPSKADVVVYVEVVRILGRPGLESAVPGLVAMLEAKDPSLRGNAAVSLEYVGSAKAVDPLVKRESREKDEVVRSNLLRALGRCGAKDASIRKTLLKEAAAKSDGVAAGAIVGLAYFGKDADVARALEKTLKANGEGSRHVATLWTLVEVGDAKTADLLKAQLAETAKVLPSYRLLDAAVACLSGDDGRKGQIDQALRWALNGRTPDAARTGRGAVGFVPKGDPAAASG